MFVWLRLIPWYVFFTTFSIVNSNIVEPWAGSALGTLEYRGEVEVIDMAKIDYVDALDHMLEHPPKPLLCVSFLGLAPYSCMSLKGNIDHMGNKCDWAIVMYLGSETEVNQICKMANETSTVVQCGRSEESFVAEKAKKSIPKSVLYRSLLKILGNYERVLLLDEDISLKGFSIDAFIKTWDCAFERRPLVVQPLIAESNQYLEYVNQKPWLEANMSDVLASTVGYVEQQVPAFDAVFFKWFIRRVLSQTKEIAMQYAMDWGHDRSWCNAANMYARDVLHWPVIGPNGTVATPCALITAPNTSVHHLNHQTMSAIRGRNKIVRRNIFVVVQRYVDLYPTWVGMDMLHPYNPLSPENAKKYHQVRELNENFCKAPKPWE